MKLLIAILLFLLTQSQLFADSSRAVRLRVKTQQGQQNEVVLYTGSYALVIGVSNYQYGWPKLPGVPKDVEAVKSALERQGFQVHVLMDPGAATFTAAVRKFISEYGQSFNHRLLFYFAGHGHTLKTQDDRSLGYIVPVDAPLPEQIGPFKEKAISMQEIENYATQIEAKHALFVFDSCFSGSIFAISRAIPESISIKTTRSVRQFITSGTEEQEVPDKSIFRQQFVDAVNGEADLNKDEYVTGSELGQFLEDRVANYSRGAQTPQYGKIRHPGLDKGDFVFSLKDQAPLSSIPDAPELDLSDLQQAATAANKWKNWQEKMDHGFQAVQSLESQAALATQQKSEAWNRFLSTYKEDNPNSIKDQEMRHYANNRMEFWRSYLAGTSDVLYDTPTGPPEGISQNAVDYQAACEKDDAKACNNLGVLYRRNIGVTRDDPRALALYEKACNAGNMAGCHNAGLLHYYGYGTQRDGTKAASFYQRGCNGGDLRSCVGLGNTYDEGFGVPKDSEKATKLYVQACNGGELIGCIHLGFRFHYGKNVKQDYSLALTHYQHTCNGGRWLGCANLGVLYRDGTGVPQDNTIALKLFKQACDAGDPTGCSQLAYMHTQGIGTPQNYELSFQFYKKSCHLDDINSCYQLALFYRDGKGITQDYASSLNLLNYACSNWITGACVALGYAYDQGLGVQKDMGKAFELYNWACDLSDPWGCNNLGAMYELGKSVQIDVSFARKLYKFACDNKYETGCGNLKRLGN